MECHIFLFGTSLGGVYICVMGVYTKSESCTGNHRNEGWSKQRTLHGGRSYFSVAFFALRLPIGMLVSFSRHAFQLIGSQKNSGKASRMVFPWAAFLPQRLLRARNIACLQSCHLITATLEDFSWALLSHFFAISCLTTLEYAEENSSTQQNQLAKAISIISLTAGSGQLKHCGHAKLRK